MKIRGLRIELGEIEAVLDQHPRVRQSVVVARPLAGLDGQLVAYVLPDPEDRDAAALPEVLRTHAAERLPLYMVPQHFVVMERLPLNANGKVDRSALPAPAAPPRAGIVPARNEMERWLVEQWRQLLGRQVGVGENLFDAGGTSLMAAQLIGRIRQHLGAEVPLVRLFEHPTIEALSAHLEAAPGAAAPDPLASARERAGLRRSLRPRSKPGRG